MPASPAPPPRPKAVLLPFLALAGFTLVFGLVAMLRNSAKPAGPGVLLVYCAASLKTPMEKIAADYARETGVSVELSLGGSQTLLASIAITQRGDLYLPADDSYIALARDKHLIGETLPLAEQTAVMAVPKGNPKSIRSLADFRDRALTLSQANPETAAIGKLLRAATEPGGLWLTLSNRTVVFKPTVVDAANDVQLGAVDAAFIWNSMRRQYPELEFIALPELERVRAKVAVSVLHCSQQPDAALKLARYIAAQDHGLKHFQQSGFVITPAP